MTSLFLTYCSLMLLLPQADEPAAPQPLIGDTRLQTSLPDGRHANVRTMRATVDNLNGSGRRELAAELANEPDSWTQFVGWSPDGATATIRRGWQSPENAHWEEEHKTFRHTKEGWLVDSHLVDIASGRATNVTGVERVSFFNSIFFWPGDPTKLGMTSLVNGTSKPFRRDRDGRNKVDLNKSSSGFAYGLNCSPDGSRIAYHENYHVYLTDADGSDRVHVATGHPFNFGPAWSPDGQWVLLLSGEHYNCHPHLVRADGNIVNRHRIRNCATRPASYCDAFSDLASFARIAECIGARGNQTGHESLVCNHDVCGGRGPDPA